MGLYVCGEQTGSEGFRADDAVRFVCEKGDDSLQGARPLRRAIEHLIVQPVTDLVLEGGVGKGDNIEITFDGLSLTFGRTRRSQ